MFKNMLSFLMLCVISLNGFAHQTSVTIDGFSDISISVQFNAPETQWTNIVYGDPELDRKTIGFKLTTHYSCCKVCRKGKACGNTCISRDKTCRQPPGCACDE